VLVVVAMKMLLMMRCEKHVLLSVAMRSALVDFVFGLISHSQHIFPSLKVDFTLSFELNPLLRRVGKTIRG